MTTATVTSSSVPSKQVTAVVGKGIFFKADIEQGAVVKEIRQRASYLPVQVRVDVTSGGDEYRGPNQWIDLADCWN